MTLFTPQPGAPTPDRTTPLLSPDPPVSSAPSTAPSPAPSFSSFYDLTVDKAYRLALLMTVDAEQAETTLQESYLRAGPRLHEPAELGLSPQAWFLTLVRETALRPE